MNNPLFNSWLGENIFLCFLRSCLWCFVSWKIFLLIPLLLLLILLFWSNVNCCCFRKVALNYFSLYCWQFYPSLHLLLAAEEPEGNGIWGNWQNPSCWFPCLQRSLLWQHHLHSCFSLLLCLVLTEIRAAWSKVLCWETVPQMYEQILQKSLAIELFHSIPHRTFSHLTTTVTCIQLQL